jgi:hypothetical protein
VAALIVTFIFTGLPLGLAATLMVVGLVVGRIGPWWQREPATSLAASGA